MYLVWLHEIKELCKEYHDLTKADITLFKKNAITSDQLVIRYNELRIEVETEINFKICDIKISDSLIDFIENLLDISRSKVALALESN